MRNLIEGHKTTWVMCTVLFFAGFVGHSEAAGTTFAFLPLLYLVIGAVAMGFVWRAEDYEKEKK